MSGAQRTLAPTRRIDLRRQIAEIEKPYRTKLSQKQRGRFPDEYARLLDVPEEKRTPLEKQIGVMIEKQVYADTSAMLAQDSRQAAPGLALRTGIAIDRRRPPGHCDSAVADPSADAIARRDSRSFRA